MVGYARLKPVILRVSCLPWERSGNAHVNVRENGECGRDEHTTWRNSLHQASLNMSWYPII